MEKRKEWVKELDLKYARSIKNMIEGSLSIDDGKDKS